jgi:sugar lactone lactonase YvrE
VLAFDVQAELGEGALWDWRHGVLVSVDLLAGRLLLSDPRDGTTRAIHVGQPVSAALLRGHEELLLAVRDGFASVELSGGAVSPLVEVEADLPGNRMNDGACDARGRCFAGTMGFDKTPGAGALYRLDPDLSVHRILDGIGISNGIGWSPDGERMYHVDTLTGGVDEHDYDPSTGEPAGRRRLVDAEPGWGRPDGLAVDVEGGIWVAFWDGWAVRRFDRAGALSEVIELPVARPTRPAFGGPRLDRLYVTTARDSGGDGGAILAVEPGVRGLPANVFSG